MGTTKRLQIPIGKLRLSAKRKLAYEEQAIHLHRNLLPHHQREVFRPRFVMVHRNFALLPTINLVGFPPCKRKVNQGNLDKCVGELREKLGNLHIQLTRLTRFGIDIDLEINCIEQSYHCNTLLCTLDSQENEFTKEGIYRLYNKRFSLKDENQRFDSLLVELCWQSGIPLPIL